MRALKSLKQEQLVFLDIETARLVKELKPETSLYDSWNYKINKDNKKEESEVINSFENEAGLYPEFGSIVSIVAGKIVNDEIVLVTFDDEDEKVLLTKFNEMVERNIKCRLVGFASTGFDIPFIFKRMIINGIEPSDKLDYSDSKPWTVDSIDLSTIWQCTSFNRASLLNIATAFGLPSPKDEISGADVGNVYWNEGRKGVARISTYCRKDVVTTINIFRKMRLQEPLPLRVTIEPVDIVEPTLIEHLFNGGAYNAKEKKALADHLKTLSPTELESAWVVLDAMTSTAASKKTKITKTHLKALKEQINNE